MSDSERSLDLESNSGKNAFWLVLSLLVHGAILAWLIFLIPAVELPLMTEKGAESQAASHVAASSERIQEVSEQIRETQAEEVRAKVEELLATEKELGALQTQTQQEFSQLAEELAKDAPIKSADALTAVAEAQAKAAEAQAEAQVKTEEMNRQMTSPAGSPEEKNQQTAAAAEALSKAAEAQARAKEAQTAATTAQSAASEQLGFQGGNDEARNAQTQASESQAEANSKQDAATELRSSLNGMKRQAEKAAANAAKAQRDMETVQQRIAEREKVIGQLQAEISQQQAQGEQAKSSGDTKGAGRAEKNVETLNKRINSATAEAKKQRERLEALAKTASAEQPGEAQMKETAGKLQTAQKEALEAQQKARVLQANAQAVAAKAFASASSASAPQTSAPTQDQAAPSLDGKSFSELYSTAVEAERAIAERFQAIRAAQVAVQKQIPLAEAQKYVQMALPVRDELPKDSGTAKSAEELAAQNAAMEKALKELESMLSLTRGMAGQAKSTAAGNAEGMSVSVEGMKAQAEQEKQLAALAAENDGQAAVDLSALMRQMSGGAPTAAQGGQPGAGAAGSGAGGQGPGVAGIGPPTRAVVQNSLPGRKVHSADYGIGDKWMFIDSWWVIGPFANPQRRNIDVRFPPESVIDLDAAYPVDGGLLRWRFVQSSGAMVRPPDERPYSIYYAYTELWFDEERDLWIATGSDDYSKIWINDLPIWASGMQHKAWKADEAYRKIHFKKGLNRVLMRVENGQSVCMFSFMLCMQSNP